MFLFQTYNLKELTRVRGGRVGEGGELDIDCLCSLDIMTLPVRQLSTEDYASEPLFELSYIKKGY